jgi:hypothetical protein
MPCKLHNAPACVPCARVALRAQTDRMTPAGMRDFPKFEVPANRIRAAAPPKPEKPARQVQTKSASKPGVVRIGGFIEKAQR